MNDVLYAQAGAGVYGSHDAAGPHDGIDGLEHIDKVINIDQSPIGRTPRSNPATYTGMFDADPRRSSPRLPESKMRGYTAGRFSFNVKGGRCEKCQGEGVLQDRDAVPARRVRHVRRLPRQALQPRDAAGEVQGQEHRRRARP